MEPDHKYAAGFFDGEGSIGINRNANCSRAPFYLRARASNTNRISVERFKKWYGGSIIFVPRPYKERNQFLWRANGPQALKFLKAILPWPKIKFEHACLAIAFEETKKKRTGRGHGFNAGEIAWREACYERMICLNRRGKENIGGP